MTTSPILSRVGSPTPSRPITPPNDELEHLLRADPLTTIMEATQPILSNNGNLLSFYTAIFGGDAQELNHEQLCQLERKFQEMMDRMKIGRSTIGENGCPLDPYLQALSNTIQASGSNLERKCLLMMEMLTAAPGSADLINLGEAINDKGRRFHLLAFTLLIVGSILLALATGGASLILKLLIVGALLSASGTAAWIKGFLLFRAREYREGYAYQDAKGNPTNLGKLEKIIKAVLLRKAGPVCNNGRYTEEYRIRLDSPELSIKRSAFYALCKNTHASDPNYSEWVPRRSPMFASIPKQPQESEF